MTSGKRQQRKQTEVVQREFNVRHQVGSFDLEFLNPRPMGANPYEEELLTAEEKAAYYEDLVRNNGVEDSPKMAKDFQRMADELKEKIGGIDPDEAMPLREKIEALEALARHYDDPTPPDVLASQVDDGPSFRLSIDERKHLSEMGLAMFAPASDERSSSQSENFSPESAQIRELKKKARFWKSIHTWSPGEQVAYYFCGPVKPADWPEAMFVRAQRDRNAVKLLALPAHRPMMRLLKLAEMGNEEAVQEAVKLLERYVRLINLCAKLNPRVFQKVASQLQSWPVVYSSHPRLNQIPQIIAKQVKLGAAIDYEFGPGTKWNPHDLGCKIAMRLYEHIKKMRQYPESNSDLPLFSDVAKLPDIRQRSSVKSWWEVAEKVLLEAYPKLEEQEVLRRLTKIQDPFKVRSKILEIIKNRFFSLFPKAVR